MKKHLKALSSFSRKELNGILVLFVILLFLLLSRPLTGWFASRPGAEASDPESDRALLEALAMLEGRMAGGNRRTDWEDDREDKWENAMSSPARVPGREGSPGSPAGFPERALTPFPFDPNATSEEELLKLGLSRKVARTLVNYRKAGGTFYRREDLKKIYGLKASIYKQLEPFITIGGGLPGRNKGGWQPEKGLGPLSPHEETAALPPEEGTAAFTPGEVSLQPDEARFPPEDPPGVKGGPPFPADRLSFSREKLPLIDLNAADSALLVRLPAIGPVLSARILRYRERLGGFHSVAQLREVYGLDTSAYEVVKPYFQEMPSPVRKIDINRADYSVFRRLPYWSGTQIRALLNYRSQHGAFTGTDALYQIKALDSLTIQKVMPYLNVQLLTGYEYDRRENKINDP